MPLESRTFRYRITPFDRELGCTFLEIPEDALISTAINAEDFGLDWDIFDSVGNINGNPFLT